VLRRISVPKRDEVTGEWGRLHNKNQVLFGWSKQEDCDGRGM
jgi:hypothetical protein